MSKTVVALILGVSALLIGVGVFVVSRNPVPKTEDKVEVLTSDHVKGKSEAAVTLVEYSDFQCPSCGAYFPIVKQLEKDYPNDLRIVYRQFPLTSIHPNAWAAATFSEAANLQGKFWEIHDKLFENQTEWSESKSIETEFGKYAKEVGLDFDKAKKDMYEASVADRVKFDQNTGEALSVSGTPTFFVNGEKIALPGGLDQFKKIIDGELAKHVQEIKVHKHFDIAIYVDAKKLNLSDDKFMEKNDFIHFHDNNDEVAHIHKNGMTLGVFVDSLGVITKEPVNVTINGREITTDWKIYSPEDLDRVTLSFGTKPTKLDVTDKACIYSEKCPERGKPPTEKCVGGVGTDCIEEK